VAWREYAENIRTKGFWIGILMLPLIFLAAVQIPVFLETKAKPSRHYVLVDYSGELEPVILRALEEQYQREVLQAVKQYARQHAGASEAGGALLERFADESRDGIREFMETGGADWFLS